MPTVRNWAGNLSFAPKTICWPRSVNELRELVTGHDRVKAIGTGHSFSSITATDGASVSLAGLPPVFQVYGDSVVVSAAMTLGELAVRLQRVGLALHTMPSLPHVSVAGAIATGTHGSGTGCLSTAVRMLTLVDGRGNLREVSDVDGWTVSLGLLGVVTTVELAVVETFDVEQTVWDGLTWPRLLNGLAEIFASAYSVSVFTDWRNHLSLWTKRRTGDWPIELGLHPALERRHPVAGLSTYGCTEQLGIRGPWHQRLPHFRLNATPSVGDELQTEYFVPMTRAVEALDRLRALSDTITPVLAISELRTVTADSLWLSPAYRRDCLAIHFTWHNLPDRVQAAMAVVEQTLADLDPRPHPAKLSLRPPDHHPNWSRFADLVRKTDPGGKFGGPA
ncbi:FAD-binding protein [Pseudonocardiaceae bacterium YIM PH 21723]|nr:FAD-binding protein [Pseudonocardiaceae bacterium YIM PH 21723]